MLISSPSQKGPLSIVIELSAVGASLFTHSAEHLAEYYLPYKRKKERVICIIVFSLFVTSYDLIFVSNMSSLAI